jgi:hypothetical protein
MHKNEPKKESNQTLLAGVTKEMDEPRMTESTREELKPDHGQEMENVSAGAKIDRITPRERRDAAE